MKTWQNKRYWRKKIVSPLTNSHLMSQFSPEQSAVFNKVRCESEKRQSIAEQIAELRAEIEKHQENIHEISGKVVQEQSEVVVKQMKIAQKQTEVAKEEEKLAQDEAELAKEQTEVAQEQVEIAKDRTEIAHEQAEILKLDYEISRLSTVDVGLQAGVTVSLDSLDENGAMKPVLIDFDSVNYRLLWGENGIAKLTEIPFKMFKALYFADDHTMTLADLEEIVWGENTHISDSTIKTTVSNLNKVLKETGCPYKVVRIKKDPIIRQARHPETKKVMEVVLQPKIEVFKLVLQR